MSLAIPFKFKPEHILYIIMWVRILRAYLYKGVQAVTLFPILPQGSFHILESNVQRGKQIPLGNSFGAGGLFPIRIRLSLLLPNAVKVKNLCVHYMILCVQNYKLTFIGKTAPLGTFTKEKSSMWNLATCANGALVISPS